MVAARAEEERARVAPRHPVEAERLGEERRPLREVADVQVHVADHRARRHAGPRRVAGGTHQVVDVHRVGRDHQLAADPAPRLARPVGVDLDAEAVRIAEVQRLADEVVAGAFYGDALGFDRTVWSYPGALFLAAGGYHHHLGTNTWAGPRALPAAADDARLVWWTVELPDEAALAAAVARLAAAGHAGRVEEQHDGTAHVVRDPWGTALRLRVAPSAVA